MLIIMLAVLVIACGKGTDKATAPDRQPSTVIQDRVAQALERGSFLVVQLDSTLQIDRVEEVDLDEFRELAELNREHGQESRARMFEERASSINLWRGETAGPLFFWNWDGVDLGPFSLSVIDSLERIASHTHFTKDGVNGWNTQGRSGDAPGVFVGVDRPIIQAVIRWYKDHNWGIVWPLEYQ